MQAGCRHLSGTSHTLVSQSRYSCQVLRGFADIAGRHRRSFRVHGEHEVSKCGSSVMLPRSELPLMTSVAALPRRPSFVKAQDQPLQLTLDERQRQEVLSRYRDSTRTVPKPLYNASISGETTGPTLLHHVVLSPNSVPRHNRDGLGLQEPPYKRHTTVGYTRGMTQNCSGVDKSIQFLPTFTRLHLLASRESRYVDDRDRSYAAESNLRNARKLAASWPAKL
jgi:hypothetical protein